MASRRKFIKAAGVAGVLGLAGCSGDGDDGGGNTSTTGGGNGTTAGTTVGGGNGTTSESTTSGSTTQQMDFQNGEIEMNVSPSVAQEQLTSQYQPIADYLENELGLPTSWNLANNYSAVIQSLASGSTDVAETGPFAAALGVKADKSTILLQRKGYGSFTYQSYIITNEDSDIGSISDLQGKHVAFADRLSASGALYPLYMMQQGGLDTGNLPVGSNAPDFQFTFTGGHNDAFNLLKQGQVDAAGMGGFMATGDSGVKSGYTEVDATTGIPRAPIVGSPNLSGAENEALVNTFLEAPDRIYWGADGEEGTDDDLWFTDVRRASLETYQPVIDVASSLGISTDFLDS